MSPRKKCSSLTWKESLSNNLNVKLVTCHCRHFFYSDAYSSFSFPSADLQWAWWKWHTLLMHPSIQKWKQYHYSGLETEIHFSCFYWARSISYAPSLSMGWLGNAVLWECQPASSLSITALYYSTCVTGLMYSQRKSIWDRDKKRVWEW